LYVGYRPVKPSVLAPSDIRVFPLMFQLVFDCANSNEKALISDGPIIREDYTVLVGAIDQRLAGLLAPALSGNIFISVFIAPSSQ
jgi:hypothetical protein